MPKTSTLSRVTVSFIVNLLFFQSAYASTDDGFVVPLMSKVLGSDDKEVLVLTVSYPPGAATPIHRHDAQVFVYVLEGTITMQVEGGEPTTIGPGEMFYESPADIHAVSKNASDTEPAKFLVFLIKNKGTPPVIPVQ